MTPFTAKGIFKPSEKQRHPFIAALLSFDYLLAAAVVALSVFSIFMVYAATNTGFTPRFAGLYISQRLHVITGAVLMIAFAAIDYRFICKFYIFIYILCIALLITVLIIGVDDATGTARWIRVPFPGGSQSLQPSEFAKIFMIIFLAKLIEKRKDIFNHILMLLLILGCIALPVYLIQLQPSLSASMVIAAASLTVLFTGGLYYRTILAGLIVLLPAGLFIWLDAQRAEPLFITRILEDYQWERIATVLNPEFGSDAYMQIQGSLYAISTGGMHGKGYLNNTYVIYGHNDLIFSVVAEQFGFVGCAVVLGTMALIIIKCILTALRADDLQGRLIAAGVAGMLIFEVFVNVGVVTSLLPATGMAFPFLSYGGSIMWVHMIAMGMVLNIGLPRPKPMFER
jgi:rod shape determining protein RodA